MGTMIDETIAAGVTEAISRWGEGAWCLAALAVAADDADSRGLAAAANEVIHAAGPPAVAASPQSGEYTPEQIAAMASAELLKAAAVINPAYAGWDEQTEEVLIAQGKASGAAARMFERFFLPQLPDLRERLATPGARMLDVGTGIGALAVGYAEVFPELTVTGIDVMPRVLELARHYVASTSVAGRIDLRRQDIAHLTDERCYDLIWIPAPFLPEAALRAGVERAVDALRPGGLLHVGHAKFDGTELENALTRFKILSYGGAPVEGPQVAQMLNEQELTGVMTAPTPKGVPGITLGRRP